MESLSLERTILFLATLLGFVMSIVSFVLHSNQESRMNSVEDMLIKERFVDWT